MSVAGGGSDEVVLRRGPVAALGHGPVKLLNLHEVPWTRLPLATSVPELFAGAHIRRSDRGASVTPSPAIAATRPPPRSRLMMTSGKIPGASVATTLKSQATPVPFAIRVSMLGFNVRTEPQPRVKERAAGPQDNRYRQRELSPHRRLRREEVVHRGDQVALDRPSPGKAPWVAEGVFAFMGLLRPHPER